MSKYITEDEVVELGFEPVENYRELGWDAPIFKLEFPYMVITFKKLESNALDVSEMTLLEFSKLLLENTRGDYDERIAELEAGEDY